MYLIKMTFSLMLHTVLLLAAAQLGHRVAVLDYVEPSLKGTCRQNNL